MPKSCDDTFFGIIYKCFVHILNDGMKEKISIRFKLRCLYAPRKYLTTLNVRNKDAKITFANSFVNRSVFS